MCACLQLKVLNSKTEELQGRRRSLDAELIRLQEKVSESLHFKTNQFKLSPSHALDSQSSNCLVCCWDDCFYNRCRLRLIDHFWQCHLSLLAVHIVISVVACVRAHITVIAELLVFQLQEREYKSSFAEFQIQQRKAQEKCDAEVSFWIIIHEYILRRLFWRLRYCS